MFYVCAFLPQVFDIFYTKVLKLGLKAIHVLDVLQFEQPGDVIPCRKLAQLVHDLLFFDAVYQEEEEASQTTKTGEILCRTNAFVSKNVLHQPAAGSVPTFRQITDRFDSPEFQQTLSVIEKAIAGEGIDIPTYSVNV